MRSKIRGSAERPRLSVFRSNRGVFAQLIDDGAERTIVAVAWTEPELRELGPMEQAKRAGEILATRAREAGIETCVYSVDRVAQSNFRKATKTRQSTA